MSTARARLKRRARRYLSVWKDNIGLDNDLGLTDINSDAEDVCCALLGIVLDAKFQNMNLERMNFPAIDLADDRARICVQVTSNEGAGKITHTLDRFFAHDLEQQYDRLIVMILGKKKDYRTRFPVREGFSFDPVRDVWDIADLLTRIAGLDMPRLERLDSYLREQFGSLQEQAPPMDLPVLSSLDDATFLGRTEELDEIARRFAEGKRFVVLSGLGGMGKSELAARFAQTRWSGESYFVHFADSWRQTVLQSIAPRIRDLNRDTHDEERIYRDAMEELKSRSSEELLILDNVDQAASTLTQLKRELSGLNLRILVTTRTEAERAIPVAKLRREQLYQFFELHESDVSEKDRNALIDAVDSHTLTVDLMARALRPGRKAATAEKLLKNLSDRTIRRVDTDYPGGPGQAQIIEHLKAVFRVSELPEAEQSLLRCATLLPQGGMDDTLFLAPFDEGMDDPLDDLIDNGWLRWSDELLYIHPVIRKVCQEELTPTDEGCGAFLNGLIDQYDKKDFRLERCRQLALLLTNAAEDLEDTSGRWALKAGERWRDVGEYDKAHKQSLRAMEQMERSLSPDAPELAQAYNNVGSTYGDLGDHRKALEYLLKALEIRERVLPPDHPDLAQSYNNLGTAYDDLGDHQKALEYKLKDLAICEKSLPPDHPDLAISYNNAGTTYSALGDHRKALEYQRKALAIGEQVLLPDHPFIAIAYDNVGTTYGHLGDYQKALEHNLKALEIFEKSLPADNPDIALSYNNAGSAYNYLGDHQKALEYNQKALSIAEAVLPANHPHLALSCHNIAWTHHALGNLQDAARFMRRAADIISRTSLPKTHPDRVNYPKWADELEKEARMELAIKATMRSFGSMPPPPFKT